MAKPSEVLYKLIWIAIIIGLVLWASVMLIGIAFNPFTFLLGFIIFIIAAYGMYAIYREQKNDKESEHYSKHIDK